MTIRKSAKELLIILIIVDISDFDAVLFYGRNLDPHDLPDQRERSADQVYVYGMLESPGYDTINYRQDRSDTSTPCH